jgi:hypothetical protein
MEVGREIATQMMAVPSICRVVHDVRPVASLPLPSWPSATSPIFGR